MFPLRESGRYLAKALAALLIATELVLLSLAILNYTENYTEPSAAQEETVLVSGLKDNWELISPETKLETQIANSYSREKLDNLANKYQADPEYLDYIIQVEKTFNLAPCELLALIAQESGFKPQTHMDGGSLSYSTTQMKMPTAKTAYMAITEYYKMEIPYPTDELLKEDKYYAAFLAGGYLRYLHDTYNNKYESYTAYNWGIGGRMIFYKNNGHFKSPYAIKVANLGESFVNYIGEEYKSICAKPTEKQNIS